MIVSITGRVVGTGPSTCVLDVGGLGVSVQLSDTHARSLDVGTEAAMAVRLRTGKDVMALGGFVSDAHRNLFDVLVGVRGVGPHLALRVLSRLSPDQLHATSAPQIASRLRRVPGVGPAAADRILVALTDHSGSA